MWLQYVQILLFRCLYYNEIFLINLGPLLRPKLLMSSALDSEKFYCTCLGAIQTGYWANIMEEKLVKPSFFFLVYIVILFLIYYIFILLNISNNNISYLKSQTQRHGVLNTVLWYVGQTGDNCRSSNDWIEKFN